MEKSMLETKRDFQKAAQISVHLYFTMVTLAGSTCGLCLTLGKESIYWKRRKVPEPHLVIYDKSYRCAQLQVSLTLSWRRPLSYRNQSIDLQSKSMDWFLYDNDLMKELKQKW